MLKKAKKILPILCACVLLFGSCLTVSAEETITVDYSELPFSPSDYDNYIVMTYSSGYLAYSCIGGDFVINSNGYVSIKGNGRYTAWQYKNSSWSNNGSYSYSTDKTLTIFNNQIVECSQNVYNSIGALVFQRPLPITALAEPLVGVVQKQITVIVPIAAFCLASVISLIILRKKLPLFLGR